MLEGLILKNRSYRKFHQDAVINRETLEKLINLARLSGSGANRQALKYIISNDPEKNSVIFKHITLAGNPGEEDAPTAYIVILGDTTISKGFGCDHGIAAQSILLGAVEKGLGGCMVGLVKRDELAQSLDIPPQYEILLVIILGKPKEAPVIDSVFKEGTNMSWVDDEGVRHVPKRSLAEIIVG